MLSWHGSFMQRLRKARAFGKAKSGTRNIRTGQRRPGQLEQGLKKSRRNSLSSWPRPATRRSTSSRRFAPSRVSASKRRRILSKLAASRLRKASTRKKPRRSRSSLRTRAQRSSSSSFNVCQSGGRQHVEPVAVLTIVPNRSQRGRTLVNVRHRNCKARRTVFQRTSKRFPPS